MSENKKKPIWVSEETHQAVKVFAAKINKTMADAIAEIVKNLKT
jgi:hypothetical protein